MQRTEQMKNKNTFNSGRLTLVSTGCGDFENITLKALRTIREADLIVEGMGCISSELEKELEGKERHEGSLAVFGHSAVLTQMQHGPGRRGGKPGGGPGGQKKKVPLEVRRQQLRQRIREAMAAGKNVVVLDNGDPALFGPQAFSLNEEFADLTPRIVPGVSCLNAANAALGTSVVGGGIGYTSLTLSRAPWPDDTEDILSTAGPDHPLVLFTMRSRFPLTVSRLRERYPEDTPVAVVSAAGFSKQQRVIRSTLGCIESVVDDALLASNYLFYVGGLYERPAEEKEAAVKKAAKIKSIMIHTPVNTRAYLIDYMQEHLPELESILGERVRITDPHEYDPDSKCEVSWILGALKNEKMPDLFITHACEFSPFDSAKIQRLLAPLAGDFMASFPLRREFEMLEDKSQGFYPYCMVPVVMCFHPELVDESTLEGSWSDLFDESRKCLCPSIEKPLSKTLGAYLLNTFPEQFNTFMTRCDWKFSPAEVIRKVAAREYGMGVTTLSFAMMVENMGLKIHSPKEGALMIPQVLCWCGNDKKLLDAAAVLMRPEVLEYLTSQGYWTAIEMKNEKVEARDCFQMAQWSGWEAHIQRVRAFESFLREHRPVKGK
jgi:precorrin-4/cobalt-precorrin-4 C11-methyltransferase